MKKTYIVGTCDTKFDELNFVRQQLISSGLQCCLVDVSTQQHDFKPDIKATEVAAFHPDKINFITDKVTRGDAVMAMATAFTEFLTTQNNIAGIIGLGGSGGTSIISKGLRSLPIGLPKIIVSTVASGDTSPYVGASDIFMLYSVTDISGINEISNRILSNATNALTGMVKEKVPTYHSEKPALGMTMFGVTTPCVNYLKDHLQSDYDCLIFHATGTGGRSLEKLIDSGYIKYVIDSTTTEICDLLMNGVMSAGEDRMGAIIRKKIPYIGSVGALDMVNFGHISTVPEKYKNRNLYKHNEHVTLMRTNKEENIIMGEWIANKLNQMEGKVRFLLPEKGVSLISVEGQPFYDPEADEALFKTLRKNVKQTNNRQLIKLPYSINDEKFTDALISNFKQII